MTFNRTWRVTLNEQDQYRHWNIVIATEAGQGDGPIRTGLSNIAVTDEELPHVPVGQSLVVSIDEPPEGVLFRRVGKVTNRQIGDNDRRTVELHFPRLQNAASVEAAVTCKVDQHAYDQMPINTPVYLYLPAVESVVATDLEAPNLWKRPLDLVSKFVDQAGRAERELEALEVDASAEARLPHPSTQPADATWRFDLTLDDAATVPYQQLCRVGALIGGAGGWWDEHEGVFRGPGAAPPQALMQWCSDNDITCSVRAG